MKPALLLYPHISSYPVLLLLGFFFGWLLARFRARSFGIEKRDLDNLALVLPIAGLFGARFFARLFYAKLGLLEALKVWEGDGLVFYGGFAFGIAAVLIYGAIRRMPLRRLADCVAPSVALGLAFGRVGCFLAGCCWGDVCADTRELSGVSDPAIIRQVQTLPAVSATAMPFAVEFPARSQPFKQHVKLGLVSAESGASLPVHPVQLYEAVLAALLCIYVAVRFGPYSRGGAAIALLLGYAMIRFATEFLRADNREFALGLTFSQIVSIYLTLFCIAILALRYFVSSRGGGKSEGFPSRKDADPLSSVTPSVSR